MHAKVRASLSDDVATVSAVISTLTGSDLAVWTALIAGGCAVLAGMIGTIGGTWATTRTLRSNSVLAREQFLRDRQAGAYLLAANHMVRVRAWADIAVDEAKGNPPRFSPKPEIWAGDEWFEMSAQLRVFGSLHARVCFDNMHAASFLLYRQVQSYAEGNPPSHEDVDAAYTSVHECAGQLGVVMTAELGPLNDQLNSAPRHRWQIRKLKRQAALLDAQRKLIEPQNRSRDESS